MDACDPGLDISNLRTLIKQNVGVDLKLSKNQICDIYSLIQGGKLPLPPLVLSKDGSYLIDAKSPLTRKEFDTLFRSTSRVDEIRRIAKKVGVVRYANKKITKQQLIDIIGRRLHSMNVHEPIKLRSVQKKQIEKIAFNNNANLVNNLNVNKINSVNNVNTVNNNVNRVNNLNRVNNSVNNLNRVNNSVNRVNNLNRVNNNLNRVNNNSVNNLSSKIKKNEKPRFLNGGDIKTSTNNVPKSNIKAFTSKKPKKPSFLNKSFIATSKIKPQNGYVFKKGNKGLGMYKNNKVVQGPVQEPRGPIDGPDIIKQRNSKIKENEILLRTYLNRENVSKYINNSEKANVYNRIKRGTKFNNVKTYINGIVSTKITNAQRIENQKLKLEQNRNELQKILSELTNLTNTNKSEILSKFNSNGKLNNAKTLAVQKNRNIKKAKLGDIKLNLETFLKNKNVNNKGTYINRLDAGEDISNLKREILDVINKKNTDRKNYELKLKELTVLLNTSKNLNNSMKSKFLRNFENTRNFNKVKKNIEDEFKKINNARKQGENAFRKEEQRRTLQKILNNSENFTNDDKRAFMQRFERGDNFNTLKENATQTSLNLAKKRKNRELEEKMKAEAELKNEERRQQRKLMNEIMNNSGLLNNSEKNVFRQRFNSGDSFNRIRVNINKRVKKLKDEGIRREKERLKKLKANEENQRKKETVQRLRNGYNANNTVAKNIINRFEKGGMFAPKTEQNTINRITRAKQKVSNKQEKEEKRRLLKEAKAEEKRLAKIEANRKAKEEANRKAEEKRLAKIEANRKAKEEANRKAKEEANRKAREEEIHKTAEKDITGTGNTVRLWKEMQKKKQNIKEKQNKFNKAAKEAEEAKAKLEEQKKKSEESKKRAEELKRKAKELNNIKEKQNKLNKATKEAEEAKARLAEQKKKSEESKKRAEEAQEIANRKAKEIANRKAKEEANRKAKEEANRKAKEEANRKAKEEANRKAKEIANKKAKALAKKKKEDEEKKKKEAENKKKAAQNQQMRASLTKKVKSTQMDQKVKNKLLNQLKNYSVQIRNVAPGIEQTIKSEKLNGNYNDSENRKKRQEVKKQLAAYIAKTYPDMSKADRKKYIDRANLTQWKRGIFSGSRGMGANQAFERIKGNIRENMKSNTNKKANLKKLVNNTMKGRAAKNVSRLKNNINQGVSEMTVKTRLAQLNKRTRYQT